MESIKIVDCVYRMSVGGELVKGSYNLQNDTIIGSWDFMQQPSNVPLVQNLYDFCPGNYGSDYDTMDPVVLYNLLLKSNSALIAINYNNIGAILVSPEMTLKYLICSDFYNEHINRKVQLFKPTKRIGVLKAPVYTLEVPQPMLYIDAYESSKGLRSVTSYGLLSIDDSLKGAEPTTEQYLSLFETDDVYGLCNIMGQVKFIIRDGNTLKVKEVR